MKLLGHLLESDLRRFRLLIAAWVALVAAGVGLYARAAGLAGNTRLFDAVQATAGLLWLARQLLRVVLVTSVVHAHPAVGSTAFWMTRPIPPRLLFASKVILIFGVAVGVPVAGDLTLAIAYHVPLREAAFAAFQTALANGAWVALLMTVAVLTPTLAQFALACGVTIMCAALVPVAAELLGTLRLRSAGAGSRAAFDPLIPVVAVVVLLASLAAAWMVQYIRRNRSEAIAVGAAGFCVALVFGSLTPPPLVARHSEPPSWARNATALELQPRPTNAYPGTGSAYWLGTGSVYWLGTASSREDTSTSAVARGLLVLPDLPPGWFARAALREATLVADGKTLACDGPANMGTELSRAATGSNPTQVALREALDVDRMTHLQFYGAESAILFVVPNEGLSQLGAAKGLYRGRFRLDLMHVEALAALPLTSGATFQDDAYRITIGDVRLDGVLTIRLQRSDVPTILPRHGYPRYDFYLRNRSQREAAGGYLRPAQARFIVPPLAAIVALSNITPGVEVSGDLLTFRESPGTSQLGPESTPEWLKGAELVVVRTTNAGTVERALQIEDFRWPAQGKR